MKKCFQFTVCFVLLITFSQSLSQNLIEPFIVSPLIGDRLDPLEKRFFNLPPLIMGFEQAEFYINSDSSVTANISYNLNTTLKDTLIDNYYNITSLQNYLIKKTDEHIIHNPYSVMDFYLNDNQIINASLYKVDNKSLSIIKPNIIEAINTGNLTEYMLDLKNEQVYKITIQEGVAVWPFAVGGTLIGLVAGGFIGASTVDDKTDNFVEGILAKPTSKAASILIGGLIGAAVGLVTGIVVGNNITTDIEYLAHPTSGYTILQRRALLNEAPGN